MNTIERFHWTLDYQRPDHVPYFEEGIREDVLKEWQRQGLEVGTTLAQLFPTDVREEIILNLDPDPQPEEWPSSIEELKWFKTRLDPEDPSRLPEHFEKNIQVWNARNHVLMLRVHRGIFQSLGIGDWQRFEDVMFLLKDRPDFVREFMHIQGLFCAQLAEKALKQVKIDAAIFSEAIGGNHGPLISPQMYEQFALRSYKPILSVLHKHKVRWIILRTYANARVLIPLLLDYGFNCLWACEVDLESMDYLDLRSSYGKDLRLIGGIDLDKLRDGKVAIKQEIEKIVPPLIADGGYIPLADGRVRADIPYENYVYYRQLISEVTQV
jgi:hypothetical protein